MIKNNLRPYEISLWTLQDSFISVLKPLNLYSKGQIETPKIVIKDDGTQELTFKVPMYYYQNNELVENPLWYDVKNGVLMVNLRKLKVIFNKGERDFEEVFEFVINKITETHTDGQLYCEVSADGLAFQELGKVGYKISFNEDTFLNEYNEWWEAEDKGDEPLANINYWCDKAFNNSKWTYKIQMDWSGFDGETANNNRTENMRQPDKIYEEEYVSSWSDTESGLIPLELEPYKEKARIISVEKSNLYNITQTIAETFGVFCKYVYDYDENYHIIGRTCVFYNNFLNEKEGHIDINYPYDSSKIERKIDSTDVITKMFVVPVEDDTSASGLITIADVAANKMKEDYILNFDYLYSIGTITQEQYDTIPDYERSMYNYNVQLIPLSTQIAKIETDLVDYRAQLTTATNGQIYDKEQMEQAVALMNAITGGDGILKKEGENTSYRAVLLQDEANSYYVKITQEGVIENTIKIFYYKKVSDTSIEKIWTEYTGSYEIVKDENGNVNRIRNLKLMEDTYSNIYYLTFEYRPKLFYENVYNTFAKQLAKDEAAEKEATDKIAELEEKKIELDEKYNELLAAKNKEIADFENMMGPALKEGSWQADDYSDFGTNYKAIVNIANGAVENADIMSFVWDSELFDDEQLNYYEIPSPIDGVLTKEYYPCIDLTNQLEIIKDYIDDLTFIIPADETNHIVEEYCTVGSEMFYGFLLDKDTNVKPVLILTKKFSVSQLQRLNQGFIGVVSSQINDKSEVVIETENLIESPNWIGELNTIEEDDPKKVIYAYWFIENYTWVIPRLEVNSLSLKTNTEDFSIKYNDKLLEKFYDYYILIKNDKYYITLKNDFIVSNGTIEKILDVSFRISNAALSIYLDALEVSKNNAFPQVSYTIDVSARKEMFIKQAYKMLSRIVNINDSDLKFENVFGYISELELHLDNFWEDKITIKNYKTKFEDLFSSIVASTEQMKSNSFVYDVAAGAFTANGSLKGNILQNTLNNVDLTYAFQGGNLTIDEVNGIWATSDNGVVAMRGGGIFCATQKDSLGNWLWNTGIVPSGINASLIKAGQIDTNLIKIYAGDNLRFQMNGDGVFAYRSDGTGEAIMDEYVVHNSEGLFLRQPRVDEEENKISIDRVEISWDGLILRDKDGNRVFYADNDTGNLKIKGEITAASGSIADWKIEEGKLVSKDGNAKLQSRRIEEAENTPYDMLYVGGDKGVFKAQSDGTIYANNAIIKGTLSAGSIIGQSTVNSLVGAVKKLEIIAFNEDCFRLYNTNLDGVITADPSWLRFQIKTNGLTEEELVAVEGEDNNYKFYYCVPGELKIEDPNNSWEEISSNLEFDLEYLTFVVKNDIIPEGEDLIFFKAEKQGKKLTPSENETSYDYTKETYAAYMQLRRIDYGTNKFLSLIDPPSYTFVKSQNVPYADTASFTITLKNINATDGSWNLGGEYIKTDDTITGSDTPKNITTYNDSSIIAVPEVNLENGVWYVNDEKIEVEEGDIISGATASKYLIQNVINEDGTGTSTIIIPNSCVPEGGQITLRYTVIDKDNNISASRTAFVFKIKNGEDSYLVHISSSEGTIFKNGVGNTTLEAELYAGATQLNTDDTSAYYYIWRKKEEYEVHPDINQISSKTLVVSAAEINDLAVYSCDIYDNYDEAELVFKEAYGELKGDE